jgi:hypothetical protein
VGESGTKCKKAMLDVKLAQQASIEHLHEGLVVASKIGTP